MPSIRERYSSVTYLTSCARPFNVRFPRNAAIPIEPIHDWIELLTGLDCSSCCPYDGKEPCMKMAFGRVWTWRFTSMT